MYGRSILQDGGKRSAELIRGVSLELGSQQAEGKP
jgi:hypothetical protein